MKKALVLCLLCLSGCKSFVKALPGPRKAPPIQQSFSHTPVAAR